MNRILLQSTKTILILNILLLLSFNRSSAQNNSENHGEWYTTQFNTADSLIGIGLPRDAEKIFKIIFDKAQENNQSVILLKVINQKMINSCYLEENALPTIINQLEQEIDRLSFPTKPIAHSILANLYWNYYTNNRWKFDNRSTLNFDEGSDIETWDLKRIVQEILNQLDSSLINPTKLSEIPIDKFNDILKGDIKNRSLRPSLYDLLVHRALKIYQNSEVGLTSQVETFRINDPNYFLPADQFINYSINTKDKNSLQYKAVRLYQKATQIHLNDQNKEALIELELNRLTYIHEQDAHSDSIYFASLTQLLSTSENDNIKAEILYYQANFLFQKQHTSSKGQLQKALSICNKVIQDYPNQPATIHCQNIKEKIMEHQLQLQAEAQCIPDQPFLVLLNYKNTSKVYFKIYKIKSNSSINQQTYRTLTIADFQKKKPFRKWEQTLPQLNDFKNHNVEVPIKSLAKGFYILMVSDKEKLTSTSNTKTVLINSSNLYLSSRKAQNGNILYLVNDRTTGIPIENASIETYTYKYNSVSQKNQYIKNPKEFTDGNGISSCSYKNTSSTILITYNNDTLIAPATYFPTDYVSDQNETKTILYTDRAIFRPGQTVHVKGLILEKSENKTTVKTNENEIVKLLDSNNQELSRIEVESNKYGTFSTSFVLPIGLLNGIFRIECNHGSQTIRVESYKRPNFEITFQPSPTSYHFNDSVKITGLTKAFSGYAIDHAKVSYKVSRKMASRWNHSFIRSSNQIVKKGETTTNGQGKFSIDFFTDDSDISDSTIIYTYTINVDVTDSNGETQSASQSLNISNTPLIIETNLPEIVFTNKLPSIHISTKTLNGENTKAQVSIDVIKLKSQNNILFDRKWSIPDTYIMNENDFKNTFPNRVYRDENNPKDREQEAILFSKSYSSAVEAQSIISAFDSLKQGYYQFNITACDSNNNKTKWSKVIQVYNDRPQKAEYPADWVVPVKTSGEPGEIAEFYITALSPDTPIRYELLHDDSILTSVWLNPVTGIQKISIPIEKYYRGGFAVQFLQITHGHSFLYFKEIDVPYTNKQLDISFSSFRNRLVPGEKEQWQLYIKNKNGEKETAEMMATLYDASLDAFAPLDWKTNFYKSKSHRNYKWNLSFNRQITNAQALCHKNIYFDLWKKDYEQLDLDFNYWGNYNRYFHNRLKNGNQKLTGSVIPVSYRSFSTVADDEELDMEFEFNSSVETRPITSQVKEETTNFESIKTRQNFNETAFFYPQLQTDDDGKITINFTMPESLTRWKMMGFAHTKTLKTGTVNRELITQKNISITSYAPRFLREGDTIIFSAKVSNLSDTTTDGNALLQLSDPYTNKNLDTKLLKSDARIPFEIKSGESKGMYWTLIIPKGIEAVSYKVMAKSGKHTDGEESIIPILSNSKLVTESLPFLVRPNQRQKYRFEKMGNHSSTLKNKFYTIEYTSNPIWYAIQAMPYLMESPQENSEQLFSRFFANSLSTKIINDFPQIKEIFKIWKIKTPETLQSKLYKNHELKELLLQETPWLMKSKDEEEQKRRLALLFDINQMNAQLGTSLTKLKERQTANGAFSWYDGMRTNRTITQHIVTGLMQLQHINAITPQCKSEVQTIIQRSQQYLDKQIMEDYKRLLLLNQEEQINLTDNHLNMLQIHYLYNCSFNNPPQDEELQKAYNYFYQQAKKYWLSKNLQAQAMLALTFHQNDDEESANRIINSLSNRAIKSEELGMYWPNNTTGYSWYSASTETQAMLIQAFQEITTDTTSIQEMKIWLLRNKQTSHWGTTKATATACYALLSQNTYQLTDTKKLKIKLGLNSLESYTKRTPHIGTGYVKTTIEAENIKPNMKNINVINTNNHMVWGAAYWQYYEQLDKISSAKTNISITKNLYLSHLNEQSNTVLTKITTNNPIHIGNKVIVRIKIRVDRDMDYVHMKDMRASGFETTSTLSTYQYQDGLGYYQSVSDASVNFFFDHLPKGVYVFEYTLRAAHSGDFSNGITTIQSMYAPEFSSHSQGIRVQLIE